VEEACLALGSLPFPRQTSALEQIAADTGASIPGLRRAMAGYCPDAVSNLEDLTVITAESAELAGIPRNDFHAGAWSCGPEPEASLVNPLDFPVGLLVVMSRGSADSLADAAAFVIPVLPPGEGVTVSRPIGGDPDLPCDIRFAAFVATPESEASDSWAAEGTEHLPDSTGDDWRAIVQALIDAQDRIATQGPTDEFGMVEDVRSSSYGRLVTSAVEDPASWPPYTVDDVCDATMVADELVAITYVRKAEGDTAGTATAVFRRAPQDGRWRWLHTSIYVAAGSLCWRFAGTFVQTTEQAS
jgi:hypothetical protein